MRYLVLLLFLTGCGNNVRISNENAIALFQAQQIVTTEMLNDPDVKAESKQKISDIRDMATSGENALVPVRDDLEQKASFIGKADAVEPDVTPEEIVKDVSRALATIDFRTKMANEEVKYSIFNKILNNPYVKWGGGIIGVLSAVAATYFGVNKFSGLKKMAFSAMQSAEDNRNVAKNAINYAKDVEDLAANESLVGEELKVAIKSKRQDSVIDQNKNGVAPIMDSIMGEVKRERKS